MKRLVILVVFLFSVAACRSNNNGTTNSGEVSLGTMTLSGSAKLIDAPDDSGIAVSLKDTNYQATTAADGSYSISQVPQSEHSVVFSKTGYATVFVPDYRFYANIDEHLPEVTLNQGKTIYQFLSNFANNIQISNDSKQVVFQNSSGLIYSVPTTGGTPTQLGYGYYSIASDSTKVVYQDASGLIYAVPIGGGDATYLGAGDYVSITPDSTKVVFFSSDQLYVVPIGGPVGVATRLTGSVWLNNYAITPDSTKVVYEDASGNLYVSLISGGSATQLANSSGAMYSFSITPDSANVVYEDALWEHLYVVPIGGGSAIQVAYSSTGPLTCYSITPDSTRVVYAVPPDIYVVPIGGGTATKITAGQAKARCAISSDSANFLYEDYISDLYVVPIAGGSATKLASLGGWGGKYSILRDSTKVAYTDDSGNLYVVPIEGGTAAQIAEFVWDWSRAPNSSTLVYQYLQELNIPYAYMNTTFTIGALVNKPL